jgi:uncharacterized protein
MSILTNIKSASIDARKARDSDKASSLITLLSEATMIGKNDNSRETTDEETIRVIKKFIKNIDDFLSVRTFAHDDPIAVKLINEKALYTTFLPAQMTSDQIREELKKILSDAPGSKMGDLLKVFKSKFEGLYNGGIASTIAKEILS